MCTTRRPHFSVSEPDTLGGRGLPEPTSVVNGEIVVYHTPTPLVENPKTKKKHSLRVPVVPTRSLRSSVLSSNGFEGVTYSESSRDYRRHNVKLSKILENNLPRGKFHPNKTFIVAFTRMDFRCLLPTQRNLSSPDFLRPSK